MIYICHPKCTTCKKAEEWLKKNGIPFEKRDIKEEKPTYEELCEWYEKSGLDIKKLFNTSGLLYKEMGLRDRLPLMTNEEKLKLLSTDGMLVKRPIVITEGCVYFGFDEKKYAEKLLK